MCINTILQLLTLSHCFLTIAHICLTSMALHDVAHCSLTQPQDAHSQSRPHHPRHPNGFFLFLSTYSKAQLDSNRPSQHRMTTVKDAGAIWRSMSLSEKKPYVLEAKAIRQSNARTLSTASAPMPSSHYTSLGNSILKPSTVPANETKHALVSDESMRRHTASILPYPINGTAPAVLDSTFSSYLNDFAYVV